jgi:hypothetical protein
LASYCFQSELEAPFSAGLLNRWGVRKPVFNAFKLLHDAGTQRWNVSGLELQRGGAGVVAYASKAHDGSVHVLVANHEVGPCNVTIRLLNTLQLLPQEDTLGSGGGIGNGGIGATVARIDDHHANAYTAWLAMGSPKADTNGTLDPNVVTALHKAAALIEEPLGVHVEDSDGGEPVGPAGVVTATLEVPHHGIARVRLASAA